MISAPSIKQSKFRKLDRTHIKQSNFIPPKTETSPKHPRNTHDTKQVVKVSPGITYRLSEQVNSLYGSSTEVIREDCQQFSQEKGAQNIKEVNESDDIQSNCTQIINPKSSTPGSLAGTPLDQQ